MGKRIWIVSEYYYPIVTSTGYYITEIAEYLASRGMDVNVISTGSRYNETDTFSVQEYEEHNGVKIHRVKLKEIDKNNFVKRTVRLLLTSGAIAKKILTLVKRNDELLVVTNPAFLLIGMPSIARIKGVSYTLLAHDIFPENLVAIDKIKSTSVIYKVLKYLFDRAYTKSSKCISIGRDMSKIISDKTKGKTPIELIPNWSDNDKVNCIAKEDTHLYKELNTTKFVFQFAGNIGHAQGIENILKAIEEITEPNITFLFIGGGAKAATVKDFSQTHDNVISLGFRPRSEQNDFLNMCDVAIVTLNDGMYGLGVPSKSYNIMATGKPILFIGEPSSEIALCIKEYGIGWVVEANNPKALAKTIENIYLEKHHLHEYSKNSRMLADGEFSKENILNKYYTLFNQ